MQGEGGKLWVPTHPDSASAPVHAAAPAPRRWPTSSSSTNTGSASSRTGTWLHWSPPCASTRRRAGGCSSLAACWAATFLKLEGLRCRPSTCTAGQGADVDDADAGRVPTRAERLTLSAKFLALWWTRGKFKAWCRTPTRPFTSPPRYGRCGIWVGLLFRRALTAFWLIATGGGSHPASRAQADC